MKIGNKGFSLVEILIVVSILGILGAIVYPEYQNHAQEAKESAAKQNLRILRNAIELYTAEHEGTPPGYLNGDISQTPNWATFWLQLAKKTKSDGQVDSTNSDASYNLGPYISSVPENPFTKMKSTTIIYGNNDFPETPPENTGWIYKPFTKEIRIAWSGLDQKGKEIYNY